MKKTIPIFFAMAMIAPSTYAGEARVTWQEPGQYTDIRPGNESPDAFQARVFKEFEKTFSDLANRLPDGYLLEIIVIDLDLAGEADRMSNTVGRDFRIIKQNDWPRMSFSYTLKNSKGELVVSGKEDLKDMSFMSHSGVLPDNTRFAYEKKMLNEWFRRQQKQMKFPANEQKAKKSS